MRVVPAHDAQAVFRLKVLQAELLCQLGAPDEVLRADFDPVRSLVTPRERQGGHEGDAVVAGPVLTIGVVGALLRLLVAVVRDEQSHDFL